MILPGELTAWVAIGKLALVAPAGTVTVVGTCAITEELLDKLTNAPPAKAGPLSTTVPAAAFPPPIVAGETVTEETMTGGCSTVKVAFWVTPPRVAETVRDVVEDT